MEIKTTYNIWDSAFVIYNNWVHLCEIVGINIGIFKWEWNESIDYTVNIEIPVWLLKKEYIERSRNEKDLFYTLWEAEEYIKYIEKAKTDVRKFDSTSISSSCYTDGLLATYKRLANHY